MQDKLTMPGEGRAINKMPGHWVLAKLGKKALRPGGKELTEKMLKGLKISAQDKVVEFAPGLGFTAKLCLKHKPKMYTAIEQNEQAAKIVSAYLNGKNQQCKLGNAQDTGLEDAHASVVYCEAMLTMQTDNKKSEIISEAARILEDNGRYGIHELCIVPNGIDENKKRAIQKDIAQAIQAPAKPLTPDEWKAHLQNTGFTVKSESIAPMHLLELKRALDDEGVLGVLKIAKNLMMNPDARKRVVEMRRVFRKHQENLAAIIVIAELKRNK